MNGDYFLTERGSSNSLSETPFQTPLTSATMRTNSRNTSGSVGISPITPPAMPPLDDLPTKGTPTDGVSSNFSQDFTPSLHASLVSEILALRRDANSKHDAIEELESTLLLARAENDTLRDNAARGAKETRALKRQLQMHEDGSYSTMELLCKERDDVNEVNAELRKKVEMLQRKSRSQDEDSRRIYKKLDLDKSKWDKERRAMERKVNVAESRMKTILAEFASREAEADEHKNRTSDNATNNDKDSVASTDINLSPSRNHNASLGSIRELQKSLAEELDFNDDDDTAVEASETSWFNDGAHDLEAIKDRPPTPIEIQTGSVSQQRPSTPSNRASKFVESIDQRSQSPRTSTERASRSPESTRRQSNLVSEMVKRFSLASISGDEPRIESKRDSRSTIRNDSVPPDEFFPQDNAPSQLQLEEHRPEEAQSIVFEPTVKPVRRHERVRSDPVANRDAYARTQAPFLPGIIEQPQSTSPPEPDVGDEVNESNGLAENCSVATQTDPVDFKDSNKGKLTSVHTGNTDFASAPPNRLPPLAPVAVPAIAVLPATAPTSPNQSESNLDMVDAACQTVTASSNTVTNVVSVGVQTDRIRIDKRLIKWPAHLRSLSQTERLAQPAEPQKVRSLSPVPEASRGNETSREPDTEVTSGYSSPTGLSSPTYQTSFSTSMNDVAGEQARWNRPSVANASSVTSDTPRLELEDGLDDAYLSDSEAHTALAKPLNWLRKQQRQTFDPPTTVPEHGKVPPRPLSFDRASISTKGRPSLDKGKGIAKSSAEIIRQPSLSGPGKKLGSINRHSRSPSFGSVTSSSISKSSGPRPPFVIPMRISSRKLHSRSSRNDTHSSPSRSRSGNRSPPKTSRPAAQVVRQPTLRKAHSAVAVATGDRMSKLHLNKTSNDHRGQSREPSPSQKLSSASPRTSHVETRPLATPTGNASVDMSAQHNVVDAITATMIGEWMWKYIRKGKSFGVQEDGQEITKAKNSDARHRRWVWLSPYEKVVMWSTKQPTSNAALLGKAGRKLPIQSVLDVKDLTPPPKGVPSSSIFSRSILVLTPARALKFTAPTHERHYLWLTALSFLAHGGVSNRPQELPPLPPLLPFAQQENGANSNSGRSSATSFLRVKSSKNGSQASSGHATPVVHEMEAMVQKFGPKPEQVPDTAFAPTVPRVPHSRKRSVTGPSRTSRPGFLPGTLRSGTSSQAQTPRLGTGPSQSKSRVESSKSFKAFDTEPIPLPHVNPLMQNPAANTTKQLPSLPSITQPPPQSQSQNQSQPAHVHTHNASLLSEPSLLSQELSPRQSMISAEFGGNSNFFDAVGVVRMSAFSKPSMDLNLSLTDPATGNIVDGASVGGRKGHESKNSEESFAGPPDIARTRDGARESARGLRRVGGFAGF